LAPPKVQPPIGSSPGFTLSPGIFLSRSTPLLLLLSLSLCLSNSLSLVLSVSEKKRRKKKGSKEIGRRKGTGRRGKEKWRIQVSHIWISPLYLPHFLALPSPHDRLLPRDLDGKGKRKSKRKKREKRRKEEEENK